MAHFEAVVGDVGPCSSFERRHAFLTAGPEMVSFLQDCGVRFVYCPGYSDYYSNAKGGHDNGRGIEPVPYDGHVLGEWLPKLQPGLAKSLGLAVMTNEARSLSHYNRSLRAFAVSARVVMRTYAARLRRQDLLTNGASLIAQMLRIALDRGIPIWTEAPLEELIVEDGRVVGVRTVRNGVPVLVRARQGVLLAAGGFAHNRDMRVEYGGDQPNQAKWSISNPGDTGDAIRSCHGHRRSDRPDGRGVVAAVTPDGTLRAVDARPGPSAAAHHVRRRGGKPVRERVQLLHGSRQGDVRPRQDQQGGPVLADLRRPLPEALRAPALLAGTVPAQAAQERHAEAGLDAEGPRRSCAGSIPPAWPRPSSASTRTPSAASTPTTGGANPPTTGPWVTRTTRSTPASGPSTRPRSTPARSCPATSARAAASSPTRTHRSSIRTAGRSPASTPPATAPPPSWAATTWAREPASPTPWSSATWPPGTPPAPATARPRR